MLDKQILKEAVGFDSGEEATFFGNLAVEFRLQMYVT